MTRHYAMTVVAWHRCPGDRPRFLRRRRLYENSAVDQPCERRFGLFFFGRGRTSSSLASCLSNSRMRRSLYISTGSLTSWPSLVSNETKFGCVVRPLGVEARHGHLVDTSGRHVDRIDTLPGYVEQLSFFRHIVKPSTGRAGSFERNWPISFKARPTDSQLRALDVSNVSR